MVAIYLIAFAIPLILLLVVGVIFLVLGYQIIQDPGLGIGLVVVVVLSFVFEWIKSRFGQAVSRWFNKKLWYHNEG